MRHVHLVAVLLVIARVRKALDTIPNSRTLSLEALRKDS